jgi:hypothetical protein
MKRQIPRDTWYQIAVAAASAVLLILLAIRFPSLPSVFRSSSRLAAK